LLSSLTCGRLRKNLRELTAWKVIITGIPLALFDSRRMTMLAETTFYYLMIVLVVLVVLNIVMALTNKRPDRNRGT